MACSRIADDFGLCAIQEYNLRKVQLEKSTGMNGITMRGRKSPRWKTNTSLFYTEDLSQKIYSLLDLKIIEVKEEGIFLDT